MAPIPSRDTPRIVVYYQTLHDREGNAISILPLLADTDIKVTHLMLAAIHLNDPPGNITLNDHPPSHPRYQSLWNEMKMVQASDVKLIGMLGGAAKGSFTRLDQDEATFEAYYIPLQMLIRERSLDGLDLDVEEPMSLAGVIRLIDRLKADFGENFIITLAPVAAALISPRPEHNLSGFSYEALEVMRGARISWYNTQFYCGWGDVSTTMHYDAIMARGFPAHKVVMGMVTNGRNGAGWVPLEIVQEVLINLQSRYPTFGGVMGWEYFNSLPGDIPRPWEWAKVMTRNLRRKFPPSQQSMPILNQAQTQAVLEKAGQQKTLTLADDDDGKEEATVPSGFEYYSDGITDD